MSQRTIKWVLILIAALPLVLSIVATFILDVNGYDGWVHLNWLEQFSEIVRNGTLYPRWLSRSFSGLGSPSFYFYPPLPYWIGSIISILTTIRSPDTLYYSVSWLSIVLSFFSIRYVLTTLSYNKNSINILSIIYAVNVYRILDLFARNSLGEQFGFVFLPLIFLSSALLISNIQIKDRTFFFCTIAGWVGVVFCNIPTLIIMTISTVMLILLSVKQISWRKLYIFILSAVTAFLICGIYLFPILYFKGAVQLEHLIFKDTKNTGQWNSLLGSVPYPDIIVSKYLCVVIGVCLLYLLLRYNFRRQKERPNVVPLQNILLIWCFLAMACQIPILGIFVHKNIFPFTLIQFYWRWDIVFMLCLPFVIGAVVEGIKFIVIKNAILTTASLGATLLLIVCFQLRGNSNSELPSKFRRDVDEYIPRSVPYRGMEIRKNYQKIAEGTLQLPCATNLDSAQYLTFHRFYWCENIIVDDSMELPTHPDSLGRMRAFIPRGEHSLQVAETTSSAEKYGIASSMIGIVCLVTFTKVLKS